MKLAIIGGGPAGLGVLKEALNDGNVECTLFEQSGKIGGLWNYSDNIDIDEDGLPIQSAIYKGMITNVPKETMTYEGFLYEKPEHAFVGPEEVLKYINKFAENFNLKNYVKFFTKVTFVEPIENKWIIRTQNVRSGDIIENIFDAVAVCNGHFFKPFFPKVSGQEFFNNTSIHSREYRTPENFKDKTVLIIGAGRSGTDISRLLAPVAKKVLISYKDKPFCPLEAKVNPKPTHVLYFKENKAVFEDKSEEPIDNIIYCTGYTPAFPFLSQKCQITVQENWVKPLYKHLINIEHPTMAIINITDFTLTFPLCELQTRFFLSLLKKRFVITKEEMLKDLNKDMNEREQQGIPKKYAHFLGAEKMEQYCEDLSAKGGVKNIPKVINEIHKCRYSLGWDCKIKILNDEAFVLTEEENYGNI